MSDITTLIPSTSNDTWGQKLDNAEPYIIPHVMIFVMALIGLAWTFITQFASITPTAAIDRCGFNFATWECAGFGTTWLAFYLISAVEVIMWILAWIEVDFFKAYMFYAIFFGLWVAAGLYLLPLIFWFVAIGESSIAGDTDLIWVTIVGSVMWVGNFLMHYFFIFDGLIDYSTLLDACDTDFFICNYVVTAPT